MQTKPTTPKVPTNDEIKQAIKDRDVVIKGKKPVTK